MNAAERTVDVLIVSYNTRELLRRCLESLDRHRPPEILTGVRVWDNGSSDASADMVAQSFPGVTLTRSPANLGFGRANNRLVEQSSSSDVLLLNSDTVLTEDVITPLLAALAADERIAIAGPRLIGPDGFVQTSSERFPTLRFELGRELAQTKLDVPVDRLLGTRAEVRRVRQLERLSDTESRDTEFLWATCWLMAREDAVAFGPFDEGFAMYDEDLDLCRRLHAAGRRVRYVPGIRLTHLGGASSSTSQAKRAAMRAARLAYHARHSGRVGATAFRTLSQGIEAVKTLNRACGQ